MKRSHLLLLGSLLLASCSNQNQSESSNVDNNSQEEVGVLGGDRDAHDCIPSAGQTWSQLKNECIQVFAIGKRLNPIKTVPEAAIISAFVLISDDQSQAELFLPDVEGSTMLFKNADHVYAGDAYAYDPAKSSLFIQNELAYKAEE